MLHSYSVSCSTRACNAAAWHVSGGMLVCCTLTGLWRPTQVRNGSLKAHSAAACPVAGLRLTLPHSVAVWHRPGGPTLSPPPDSFKAGGSLH